MTDSNLTLEKYDGQEGLSLLYDDWLSLVEKAPNRCFYHDPDWFSAYFASRDVIDPQISFFAVRRDNTLVAVLPVQRSEVTRPLRPRVLFMPVESQLYMPDCAVAASENLAEIITFFLEKVDRQFGWSWDRFTVSHTLEDSSIARALAQQKKRKLRLRPQGTCSVVPLRPYDDLLKRMKAKHRQNINRARRRITSLDSAEFSVAKDFDDVVRTFQEFIELEVAGWKGGKGSPRGDVPRPAAILLNVKKRRFYESVIRAFAIRGNVEIFCVRVNGKLIGAEVWLVLGDTCYAMKTAYDETFRQMSPGVMAFDLGYQHHAAAGTVTAINTITSSPAVDDWLPIKLSVQRLDLFNSTCRGRLFAAALSVRDMLRPSSRSRPN